MERATLAQISNHLDKMPTSNGEIRVYREGVTFAAPLLIVHYIEDHGYLPPAQFLKAIEEAPS